MEFTTIDPASMTVRARYAIPPRTLNPARDLVHFDKIRWSPDGNLVLISWSRAIAVDLRDGSIEKVAESQIIADWRPDSRGWFYFRLDNSRFPEMRIVSLESRLRRAALSSVIGDSMSLRRAGIAVDRAWVSALELSGSGRSVLVATTNAQAPSRILVFAVSSGVPDLGALRQSITTGAVPLVVEWSPNEDAIAALVADAGQYQVQEFNLRDGSARTRYTFELRGAAAAYLRYMRALSWSR
jgi:Tol biopolymer transport system component